MKTLKFTFMLLAVMIFTSCTTTKISYEEYMTRQAEPVMTSPYITPTIADLEISETKETINETYKNDLTLKSKFDNKSVEAWKEATLAKMMREFNSDVIVAPTYNVTTSKDMKNITVEISGYPAKYVNFRSLSVADSAAMRAHAIEIAKGGFTDYERITEVRTHTNKKTSETIEKMSRLGNFFSIEAGANLGLIDGDNLVLDVQGVYGVQINNYLGIGGGTGFLTTAIEGFDKKRAISIPLFVNLRGYFFESGVTPYYNLDFGFLLPIKKAKLENNLNGYGVGDYINQYTSTSFKGLVFSPELGLAFGKFPVGVEWKFYKSHSSVTYGYDNLPKGYTVSDVNEYLDDYNYYDKKIKESSKAFFLKVGLTF